MSLKAQKDMPPNTHVPLTFAWRGAGLAETFREGVRKFGRDGNPDSCRAHFQMQPMLAGKGFGAQRRASNLYVLQTSHSHLCPSLLHDEFPTVCIISEP